MPLRSCRPIAFLATLILLSATALSQPSRDKAWSTLQAGLADGNTDNRTIAVRLLGALTGNAQAAQLAIKALSDEKPEVRTAAADVIASLEAKATVPELTRIAQNDKEAGVVIAAARALIALDDPLGYNVFFAVLTGEKKSGSPLMDDQKKMLKDPKKLAQFGFEQGVGFIPFGGVGLTVVKSLTKDDASPVRAASARVLANDPDPKTLAALEAATSDNSWLVRSAAIAALSQRNDFTAISTLETHLNDDKEAVRYAAAATIIHLNDVHAAKPATALKAKAVPTTKPAAKP